MMVKTMSSSNGPINKQGMVVETKHKEGCWQAHLLEGKRTEIESGGDV